MKKLILSALASVLMIFGLGMVATIAPNSAYADDSQNQAGATTGNNIVICPDGTQKQITSGVEGGADYATLCKDNGGSSDGIFSNTNMMKTLNTVLNVIVGLVGFVAVAVMILGGISFATSQGDTAKTARAKNMIIFGLVGLIVALLAFAIVNFVLTNVFK